VGSGLAIGCEDIFGYALASLALQWAGSWCCGAPVFVSFGLSGGPVLSLGWLYFGSLAMKVPFSFVSKRKEKDIFGYVGLGYHPRLHKKPMGWHHSEWVSCRYVNSCL
jgi:hypothetical protein